MKRIKGQKGNESKDLCQGKRQLPCFLKQAHNVYMCHKTME